MRRSRELLIVGVVVALAVIAVAAFVITERENSNKCSETGNAVITMFGKLTLASGSAGSNFNMTVINGTCTPVIGITVTSLQPPIAGVLNSSFVEYNGTL